MARKPLEPREDREVFELPLEVRPEHIDENGHVNNVVYVGWLQDAGTAHWNARFDAATRGRWSWVARVSSSKRAFQWAVPTSCSQPT